MGVTNNSRQLIWPSRMMKMPIIIIVLVTAVISCDIAGAGLPQGTVVEWGQNLGGGATGVSFPDNYYSTSAVMIAGRILDGAVRVSAGNSHGLALTTDGTIYGWGWNSFGQSTGV